MKSPTERELMRLLHAELPRERALELRRRLEDDAELAARYRRLERVWESLEAPPPSPVPAGFAARVVAAARREPAGSELSWSLAPAWVRLGAAAALAAGVWLGASATRLGPAPVEQVDTYAYEEPLSLAESYWLALEEGAPP